MVRAGGFTRAIEANDRAARLEARFGIPNYESLVIRHIDVNEDRRLRIQDYFVDPLPKVMTVSPRLVNLTVGTSQQAITVAANDLQAEISRSVPYEWLVRPDKKRVKVFVGVERWENGQLKYLDEEGTLSAKSECFVIFVGDRDCCHWNVLLRKVKD